MSEKKHVAKNYHIDTHTVFDLQAFLDATDKWITDNHYHKEIKTYQQKNSPKGSDFVYCVEAWNHVGHHAHGVVRMYAKITGIKEVESTIKGKKWKRTEATLHIEFDGFVESHFAHGWANKPLYYFLRGFAHRFFYRNLYDMYDGQVAGATASFYNTVRALFLKKQQIP